jgi:hypothetical protein
MMTSTKVMRAIQEKDHRRLMAQSKRMTKKHQRREANRKELYSAEMAAYLARSGICEIVKPDRPNRNGVVAATGRKTNSWRSPT